MNRFKLTGFGLYTICLYLVVVVGVPYGYGTPTKVINIS